MSHYKDGISLAKYRSIRLGTCVKLNKREVCHFIHGVSLFTSLSKYNLALLMMFFFIFSGPTQALNNKKNANESALGPVLKQGKFGWCFSYVLADLVSQSLGHRVSAAQIALNHLLKRHKDLNELAIKGGGYDTEALLDTNKIGFCSANDTFGGKVQNWIERNGEGEPPDEFIPSVLLTLPIARNILSINWYINGYPTDLLAPLGINRNNPQNSINKIGNNCRPFKTLRENADSYIQCDSYNNKALGSLDYWGFYDLVQNIPYYPYDPVSRYLAPNLSGVQAPIGEFDRIGASVLFDNYVVEAISQTEIVLRYSPYKYIKNQEKSFAPRVGYLINQCTKKFKIKDLDQSMGGRNYDYRSADSRQEIVKDVDEVIDNGHILGLQHRTATEDSHIITITGRICEKDQVAQLIKFNNGFIWNDALSSDANERCIYTVRDSADLNHKYITANFIENYGISTIWIR